MLGRNEHKILERAVGLLKSRDVTGVDYARCAARLTYQLCSAYYLPELERGLIDYGKNLIGVNYVSSNDELVVAFLDDFALDNRGLSEQYLIELCRSYDKVFYIVNRPPPIHRDSSISKIIAEYCNVEVKFVAGLNVDEKIKSICSLLQSTNAARVFCHLSPWSVEATIALSTMSGLKKTLIDITDHNFWLGASIFDDFIGFRDYGRVLAVQERGISPDKYMVLRYYPILPSKVVEFDLNVPSTAVVLFSGSNFFKIYGDDGRFFNLIDEILTENSDAYFVFAGSGNPIKFKSFWSRSQNKNRVLLLGPTNNIAGLFNRCDVFVNTYPHFGGLMTHYAVSLGKPVVGFRGVYAHNFAEDVIHETCDAQISIADQSEFVSFMNALIRSDVKRKEHANSCKKYIRDHDDFHRDFGEIKASGFVANAPLTATSINILAVKSLYSEIESKWMGYSDMIIVSELGLSFILKNPFWAVLFFTKSAWKLARILFYRISKGRVA